MITTIADRTETRAQSATFSPKLLSNRRCDLLGFMLPKTFTYLCSGFVLLPMF